MIGKVISHYRILEELGRGGMGIVYKAEDTSLKRTVALKFLPPTLLTGEEQKIRFVHEARSAAALNHPNIATVFAIDEAEQETFIALELVEGESIDKKIATGPLKLGFAIDVATQLCEGLQAAHDKGIVHRDIKSANVMVTDKGQVKILDFGLAKLKGATRMTREGTTLGTIGYMSPEQLRGDTVDHRTDIWSAGVVLYEMIAGRSPFAGEYEQAMSYQILNEQPEPLTAIRTGVPMELERVVMKMIAKNPGERYQSAREIPVDLKTARDAVTRGSSSQHNAAAARQSGAKYRTLWPLAVALFFGVILGGTGIWFATRHPELPQGPRQLRILTVAQGKRIEESAISPDGSQVAYTQDRQLYVRNLAQTEARAIPGTKGAKRLFWSPRSDGIGYATENTLWRVSADGGRPIGLCTVPRNLIGVFWNSDGHIIFGVPSEGLYTVPEQGGDPKRIVRPDSSQGEYDFHDPSPLPGGGDFLAVVHSNDNLLSKIALVEGTVRRIVLHIPSSWLHFPAYDPTGYLVFFEDSPRYGIWAVPFSPASAATRGDPFLVKGDAQSPSVANDGSLVCVAGPRSVMRLAWVSRTGHLERFIGDALDQIRAPTISPDGKRIAVTGVRDGAMDIWVFDLTHGIQTRLSTDGSWDQPAVWSPESDRIIFQSGTWGGQLDILTRRVDGSGPVDTLLRGPYVPVSWSRDGRYIVCLKDQRLSYFEIKGGNREPTSLGVTSRVSDARLSPDGKLVAFVSAETGRPEVYVATFPDGGHKWRVSVGGGLLPKWANGGKELLFLENESLVSVRVTGYPGVSLGKPERLFTPDTLRGYLYLNGIRWADPSADGQHFVLVTEAESSDEEQRIVLLENWQGGVDGARRR